MTENHLSEFETQKPTEQQGRKYSQFPWKMLSPRKPRIKGSSCGSHGSDEIRSHGSRFLTCFLCFSLSLLVSLYLCLPLLIPLAQMAAPTTEASCIWVHQFKFPRSRIWLAQPTHSPWTTFPHSIQSSVARAWGQRVSSRFKTSGKQVWAWCALNHIYCLEIFTAQVHTWVTFNNGRRI